MERATRKTIPPSVRFETELLPWMGFVIMPLFALANAGHIIEPACFSSSLAWPVVLGLVPGKPVGIILFSWLWMRTCLAEKSSELSWKVVGGGALLTGVGFTMALFITSLALEGSMLDAAKVGILLGSLFSALLDVTLLTWMLPDAAGNCRYAILKNQ